MTNREQTRRDAERVISDIENVGYSTEEMYRFADACLALLAELKQAERQRDEWKDKAFDALEVSRTANDNCERMEGEIKAANARLVKVPALVEALRKVHAVFYSRSQHLPGPQRDAVIGATDALAAYEQEQHV